MPHQRTTSVRISCSSAQQVWVAVWLGVSFLWACTIRLSAIRPFRKIISEFFARFHPRPNARFSFSAPGKSSRILHNFVWLNGIRSVVCCSTIARGEFLEKNLPKTKDFPLSHRLSLSRLPIFLRPRYADERGRNRAEFLIEPLIITGARRRSQSAQTHNENGESR